jgi:hypothetical protein
MDLMGPTYKQATGDIQADMYGHSFFTKIPLQKMQSVGLYSSTQYVSQYGYSRSNRVSAGLFQLQHIQLVGILQYKIFLLVGIFEYKIFSQ